MRARCESWIVVLVGSRPKPLPVESRDFLDRVDHAGRIHSELVQCNSGNRVTNELQLLEAVPLGVLVGTIPFGPDIFVPDFVGCQRL